MPAVENDSALRHVTSRILLNASSPVWTFQVAWPPSSNAGSSRTPHTSNNARTTVSVRSSTMILLTRCFLQEPCASRYSLNCVANDIQCTQSPLRITVNSGSMLLHNATIFVVLSKRARAMTAHNTPGRHHLATSSFAKLTICIGHFLYYCLLQKNVFYDVINVVFRYGVS